MINQKEIKRIKETFHNRGYVVLKNFMPKKLINEIKNDVKQLLKMKKIKNKLENVHYLKTKQLSSVHNIANYMSYHKKFLDSTRIKEVFHEIFGPSEKKWFNSSYFLKPRKVGIATKAHQDNAFFNLNPCEAFTCWVPTDSVTKQNSSLYYYSGSNKGGLLPHEPQGNLGASLCIPKKYINRVRKKYKKHYVQLKKGDCIIHNPLVVHGSERNRSSIDRGAFNFSIKSKKAKKDVVGWNNYRKKLSTYLKIRKRKK